MSTTLAIHVHTQYLENYGTPEAPYWKFKGGDTVVLTGFSHPLTDGIGAAAAAAVEAVREKIEYRNVASEVYILDWEFAPADALTDDERLQKEYDGRIDYPSKRLPVAVVN